MTAVTYADALAYIDRTTGGVFTGNSAVDTYLREGYEVFCRVTGVLVADGEPSGIQDVASQAVYALPAYTASVERMSYLGRTLPVYRSEQLTAFDNQALVTEGTVIGYLLDGDGVGNFRKYRIPAATDVDSRTHIEYIKLPTPISHSDYYEIPSYMARLTWYYALSKLLRRNGVAQDLKFADHFEQRYLAGVQRVIRRKSKYQSRRTGVLGGGPTTKGIPIGPRLPWEYGEVVR